MNTSMILICTWLICRLGTTLHTKCCGAVNETHIEFNGLKPISTQQAWTILLHLQPILVSPADLCIPHPTDEKVTCIKQAPTPSTVTELKAFMGLLNYYGKFIPNLATVLAPLYRLLQKDTKWNWGRDQQEAFKCAKEFVQSSTLLVHYDLKRQLVLTCDASPLELVLF